MNDLLNNNFSAVKILSFFEKFFNILFIISAAVAVLAVLWALYALIDGDYLLSPISVVIGAVATSINSLFYNALIKFLIEKH